MGTRLITPPADVPVSLEDVKLNLRIDHTEFDTRLEQMITDATQWTEARIQQKLMTQTWEFVFDYFPGDEVRLPFRPVQSIVSVKYDDTAGTEQTIDADDYYLDDASFDAWVFPIDGWPTGLLDAVNAVRIQFVAGYASAALIPGHIKQAIHVKVQEFFDGTNSATTIHDLLTNEYLLVA